MAKRSSNSKVEIEELDYEDPDLFQETEEGSEHPGRELFKHVGLKTTLPGMLDLLEKSDVPPKMVRSISRMLYIAETWNVPAIANMVKWYLAGTIGQDRQARKEFLEILKMEREEDLREKDLEDKKALRSE